MTLQDLFNNALWGVIQQGALASDSDATEGAMRCRYRMAIGRTTLACGIGQSLPAGINPTEGQCASEVLRHYEHYGDLELQCNTFAEAIIELPHDDGNLDSNDNDEPSSSPLVDHLQRCHDRAINLDQFRDNMRAFARQAGLLYDEACPAGWVPPFRRAA